MQTHQPSTKWPTSPEQSAVPVLSRPAVLACAYLLLTIAALYPVFAVTVPPLVDYPAHLARLHILAALDETPALQRIFTVQWAVRPYLAMDALVPALTAGMSVYDAGKVFVAASLVLIAGGTVALHRVLHGRIGLWPAAVYLFLYSHLLAWGFISYLFAVGLFLLAFAAWIATGGWPAGRRVAVFSAAAAGLFLSHLFAFAMYGLAVAAYELWRTGARTRPGERRPSGERGPAGRRLAVEWGPAIGQFAIPAVLWLVSERGGIGPMIEYGDLHDKLRAVLSPSLMYGHAIDFAILGLAAAVVITGVVTRRVALAPALRLPLLALGAAAVAMPSSLMMGWGVDFRLPLVLVCLVIAGMRFDRVPRAVALAIAMVALLLFGARLWTITAAWQAYDRQFAEFRWAARVIEEGAVLLVAQQGRSDTRYGQIDREVYRHMAELALVDHAAFSTSMFYDQWMSPIGLTPSYAEQRSFNYVLLIPLEAAENPAPGHLEPVTVGSFFVIYRVLPGSTADPAWVRQVLDTIS